MYGALFVAHIANHAETSLNVSALQGAIFKVLAGSLTLIGLVLFFARQAVG